MPELTIYVQPSVRQTTTWTPALIRSTLSSADGGYLRQAASLCDAILGDERARADFQTRVGSLLGLPVWFEEATESGGRSRTEGDDRSDQVKALEDDREWWRIVPEPQALQVIIWGLLLGVCPGRLRTPDKPDERTGRLVPTIEFWHPQHLRWNVDVRKWFIKTGRWGSTEVELTPGVDGWFLYAPYGIERPWAMGLWRGLSRWWLLKSYAIDDSGRHSEIASQRVAKDVAGKATKDQRRELASDIYDCARDGVIVLPPGFEYDLVESEANFEELYGALEKAADTAITISIRGANLGTEVEGGSYAAAKAHLEVDHKRMRSDAETFSTFAHDQLLAPWAGYNWGDPALAPWPAWQTDPPADEKQKADVLEKVSLAIEKLLEVAAPVDVVALLRTFNVPIDEAAAEAGLIFGKVEEFHLTFGILTKNEHRARFRQPPTSGGGVAPMPGAPMARLRSGDHPRLASGFVEGQGYTDAVADHMAVHHAEDLSPMLAELSQIIDGAEDFDEARSRLVEMYEGRLTPEELAEKAEHAFVLQQLGGMLAVRQDAPEIKAEETD